MVRKSGHNMNTVHVVEKKRIQIVHAPLLSSDTHRFGNQNFTGGTAMDA